MEWALEIGAGRVLIGSLAAAEPRLVGELATTTGRVAVAADCRDGSIRTHGWERDSEQAAESFVAGLTEAGVCDFLVTAIGRDGTGLGPDIELLEKLRPLIPGLLIAAGGVGSADHVRDAVVAGADAVVVGRALMDGSLTVSEGLASVKSSLTVPHQFYVYASPQVEAFGPQGTLGRFRTRSARRFLSVGREGSRSFSRLPPPEVV